MALTGQAKTDYQRDYMRRRRAKLAQCPDPLVFINRLHINTLAQGARLPTMVGYRDFVKAGSELAGMPTPIVFGVGQDPPFSGSQNALEIRRGEDIAPAFEQLNGRAQALYVCPDPLVFINRLHINTLAQGARLPTMVGYRDFVKAGALVSYGPDVSSMFRRAGDYVDNRLPQRQCCRINMADKTAPTPAGCSWYRVLA